MPLDAAEGGFFERSLDQAEPRAVYVSHGQDVRVLLEADGVAFRLEDGLRAHEIRFRLMGGEAESLKTVHELSSVGLHLIGVRPTDRAPPLDQPERVRLESIYPGIDLDVGLNADRLRFDILVSAEADPAQVQMAFDGADRIDIDANGNLTLATPLGALILPKPVIFQDLPGVGRKEIGGDFHLRGAHLVGLALEPYDRSQDLVIRLPAEGGGFVRAQ